MWQGGAGWGQAVSGVCLHACINSTAKPEECSGCPSHFVWPCIPAAADDCAIKSKLLVGRRGIAGTVLVHKVAGAAAAAGGSLEEVKAAADAACANIGTIGASLTECTMFGHAPANRHAAMSGFCQPQWA